MLNFFAEKNVSSLAKNIRILYIESAKTVNEMTLNELVLNNCAQVVKWLLFKFYSLYPIELRQLSTG